MSATNKKYFVHYAIIARSEEQFFDSYGNAHTMDFKSSHNYGYNDIEHWGDIPGFDWAFNYGASEQIISRQLTKKQRKALEQSLRLYYFNLDADNGPYGRII